MSRRIRSSKYRHVFTDGPKKGTQYTNIVPSAASGDHQAIKCNTKFWATGVKGGGGPVLVVPHTKPGGAIVGVPLLNGHTADVSDMDFNPFNEHMLVTGGQDAKMCLWKIPEGGLTEKIDPIATVKGNKKKVLYTLFNPSADNILATADGNRGVHIFDVTRSAPVMSTGMHTKLIQDLKWNYDGSLVATTAKDKCIRMFDPRAGEEAVTVVKNAMKGLKTFKLCFLHNHGQYVAAGFDRTANRVLRTFDIKTNKVITEARIDSGAGYIMPFYDEGTNLLFLSGKGDSNIRIFERTAKSPYQYECSNPRVTTATKGICMMPKRALNILGVETARFYKLVATGVEPISFTIPRRDEGFQEDLFPDDMAGVASLSNAAWLGGENKPPMLTSMDPENLEAAAASAAASGASAAVFVPKGPKSVDELKDELRSAKLKIKSLQAKKLKLLGQVAKKKAKGGNTKKAEMEIDMSDAVAKDDGDNWDDEDVAEAAPPVPEAAPPAAEAAPAEEAEAAPAEEAEAVPEAVPEVDADEEKMAQLREIMGDAVDFMPQEKVKELLSRFT